MAWYVSLNSPAEHAGITEERLHSRRFTSAPIHSATDVTKLLFHAGVWTEVKYQIRRGGESFEVPLITAPQDKPLRIENYLRLTAILYLFIGLFIFAKRWNAPRAMHFYVFCLVSFIFYSFHYSGKPNSFDWTVYWGNSRDRLAAACAASPLRAGVSRAPPSAVDEIAGDLHRSARAAHGSHFRGRCDARFHAVDYEPADAGPDRVRLSRRVLPAGCGHLSRELFPGALCWNLRRSS